MRSNLNSYKPGHLEREHEGEGSGNKERVCRELDPYQGARYVKAANGKERRSQHDKLEPDEGHRCVNVVEKFRNPRNPINNDADAHEKIECEYGRDPLAQPTGP